MAALVGARIGPLTVSKIQRFAAARAVWALLAALILQACTAVAPEQPRGPEYGIDRAVWFVTNRGHGPADPAYSNQFTGERGAILFGRAEVVIAPTRCAGCLAAPEKAAWGLGPVLEVEATDGLFLRDRIAVMTQDALLSGVAGELAADPSAPGAASVTVFVHGYNVDFAAGALRAAQLVHDLDLRGPVILFSWPSRAAYGSYFADRASAEAATGHLAGLLDALSDRVGGARVSVVAHSMGNVPLIGALNILRSEGAARGGPLLGHVIFTAPDVDADVFRDRVARALPVGERFTLYASNQDAALRASRELAGGYPRAGDTTDGVLILDGVETIDASRIETDVMGHSYFADSMTVIGDIRGALLGMDAASRPWLKRVETEDGAYWVLDAS